MNPMINNAVMILIIDPSVVIYLVLPWKYSFGSVLKKSTYSLNLFNIYKKISLRI